MGNKKQMKKLSKKELLKLDLIAVKIRKHIIEMLYQAKSGHPGGSLSVVDVLVALYFVYMKHNPKKPNDPHRDRFILSKGHAAPALYATLAEVGYFNVKELDKLRKINSILQGHPVCTYTPGVEASTGSLGHGLSFSNGVALAGKLDKKDYKVYCLMGDGETGEGQVWEAAAVASHYKLDNITAMIDRNYLQIDGNTEDVLKLESVKERWSSFGWYTIEIEGHNIEKILEALDQADNIKNKPTIIILNTTKGKGVSFMENVAKWHHGVPTEAELKQALAELDAAEAKLRERTK